MADEQDYILEIQGLPGDQAAGDGSGPDTDAGRTWIGMQFGCCGVYTRIYRNREGTAYVGHCPRCARLVRVRIGPDGTHHRMFLAQ